MNITIVGSVPWHLVLVHPFANGPPYKIPPCILVIYNLLCLLTVTSLCSEFLSHYQSISYAVCPPFSHQKFTLKQPSSPHSLLSNLIWSPFCFWPPRHPGLLFYSSSDDDYCIQSTPIAYFTFPILLFLVSLFFHLSFRPASSIFRRVRTLMFVAVSSFLKNCFEGISQHPIFSLSLSIMQE